MTWSDALAYAVLALTYLGLGLGYLPGYRMNRAAIAITGAALLVVTHDHGSLDEFDRVLDVGPWVRAGSGTGSGAAPGAQPGGRA